MRVVEHVKSQLDMDVPLPRKKLLAVRKGRIVRGEIVSPTINMNRDTSLDFAKKIVERVKIGEKALDMPQNRVRHSKYSAKIS